MTVLTDTQVEAFIAIARTDTLRLVRRHGWILRVEGADGIGCLDHPRRNLRVIHSIARCEDGEVWEHVSPSRRDRKLPTWEQTRDVFHEVCGDDALGLIVVPPKDEHVDIAEVSHVWRCLTKRPTPDFTGKTGSI